LFELPYSEHCEKSELRSWENKKNVDIIFSAKVLIASKTKSEDNS